MIRFFRPAVLLPIAILAIAVAGFFIWQNASNQDSANNQSDSESINLDPATEEQKNAAGTNNKEDNLDEESTGTNQQSEESKKSVDVIITTWSQSSGAVKVNGYVQGIVEQGGTCKLTLEKDGKEVTSTRSAEFNAQNTTCGQSEISVSKLSPGTWEATLSYSSDKYAGASSPLPIEVSDE